MKAKTLFRARITIDGHFKIIAIVNLLISKDVVKSVKSGSMLKGQQRNE